MTRRFVPKRFSAEVNERVRIAEEVEGDLCISCATVRRIERDRSSLSIRLANATDFFIRCQFFPWDIVILRAFLSDFFFFIRSTFGLLRLRRQHFPAFSPLEEGGIDRADDRKLRLREFVCLPRDHSRRTDEFALIIDLRLIHVPSREKEAKIREKTVRRTFRLSWIVFFTTVRSNFSVSAAASLTSFANTW